MPWYIYLALKQLFPSGRRISLFGAVSITGVALGVGVLYTAMSIMNGFQQQILVKMRDTYGNAQVRHNYVIENWKEHVEKLEAHPEVKAAVPIFEGMVMMQHNNYPAFPMLWAVDPNRDTQVIPFKEKDMFILGGIEVLDDDSIILGRTLAASIKASVGDRVEIYSPLIIDKLERQEVLMPRVLDVVGIVDTGWSKFDASLGIVTLRLMQELYGFEEHEAYGIQIRLTDQDNNKFVRELQAQYEGDDPYNKSYWVTSWLESDGDFLQILAMEKAMIFLVAFFITLVAVFSIASTQVTTIYRKTKEIGLLGALGGRPAGQAFVYTFQALVVSTLGCLFGIALAFILLALANDLVTLAFQIMGVDDALIRFYQFDELPVHHNFDELAIICAVTIGLTFLSSLVPAIIAARLKPSEALRHE